MRGNADIDATWAEIEQPAERLALSGFIIWLRGAATSPGDAFRFLSVTVAAVRALQFDTINATGGKHVCISNRVCIGV